jgi:FixJ family two-component response regulator
MNKASPAILTVVDDDASVLSALRFLFEMEGFDVRAYRDGESLLAERDLPESGCMIIDYKLPGANGLEVVRRIRRRGVTMPAVLITTPSPHVLALAAAAKVPVVAKPNLDRVLMETVRGLLASHVGQMP